jgi:hypothetical protein
MTRRWKSALAAVLLLAAVAWLAAPAVSQWAAITTNSITAADTSRPITIDGGATNGVNIGSLTGAFGVKGLYQLTVSITPGSQGANTCAVQNFTVAGTAVGDIPILRTYPATGNATGYGAASVTTAGQVAQTVCNPTAGALTPAAGTFIYVFLR